MVELTLIADMAKPFIKDCYVSVRVGESQKLARIAENRHYKFPQAGERTYGKIEIYRRIGSCGVDVDPQNEGTRSVHINCGEFGTMDLDVEVGPPGPTAAAAKPAPKLLEPKETEKIKAQQAKDYLRKHSVELQLAEAMQAVLRERPDNPVQFLAQKLMSNMNDGGVALAPASPTNPTKTFPIHKGPAPMKPFKPYFQANFRQATQAAFDRMYSRFPPPKKTLVFPTTGGGRKFQQMPSVGTWLVRRKPTALEDAKPAKAVEKARPAGMVKYPLPAKYNRRMVVSSGAFGPTFGRLGLRPCVLVI